MDREKSATILIVNDDQGQLDLLRDLLEPEGYKVFVVETGHRALDLGAAARMDLVVADVVMPGMNAMELCRRLKRDSHTAGLPVLVVSAIRKEDAAKFEGLAAAADDYIEIPFRHEELLVKVARLIERHRVERHYRGIVEHAADIIYTRDMDGRITSINEAGARFFGKPSFELIAQPLASLIGENAAARDIAAIKNVKSFEPIRFTDSVQNALGESRDLEGIATIERDAQGEGVAVRAVVRDVTERRLAELALQKQNEEYRLLFESNPCPMYVCDQKTLQFLAVNQAAIDHYGYTRAEFLGMTVLDIRPSKDAPALLSYFADRTELGDAAGVWKHKKKDGSLIDADVNWHRLDFAGRPAYLVMANDVTEKTRAEQAVVESEERYRELFENANDIIYTIDLAGNFTSLNRTGERLTGYSRAEALTMNIAVVVAPDYLDLVRENLARKLDSNESSTVYEAEIITKSGERRRLELSSRVIFREGKPIGVQGIARDITERRKVEGALAQQGERAALINRISQAVRRTLDVSEVFQTAVRELGEHLRVDRCSLFMKDEKAGRVINAAEYHVADIEPAGTNFDLPQVQGLTAAMEKHGVMAFDDLAADERSRMLYERVVKRDVKSIMYVGVKVGDELLGAFALSTTKQIRHWSEADIEVAKAAADQTGIAIRQARLYQTVARAKKEWESTFDAMSDGIFIFDKDGELVRVNRAGAAMDNAPPESLLGRKCCDILRTTSDGAICIVEQALRRGGSINVEIVPQSLKRPVLVTVEPVLDEVSKKIGAVCTARDLSELRNVEAVARERQSLLNNIMESAREAIYALDQDGRYKWCNPAMLEMTGYSSAELIGHSFLERVHEDDREMRQERFVEVLAGKPQSFETRYIASDGSVRFATVNSAPIIVDGQTTGVLGIAHDITEQKHERERAARADKLRALGQLASGVAHDFNNSLAAILGRAQLILRRVKDEDLIRSLGIIVTSAEDAAATVRRIQTFARKSVAADLELLDIGSLLRDAIEITRTRWENEARAAGLHIDVAFHGEDGLFTKGNPSELREVFVNLIFNAVDAMPLGGSLTISSQRKGERIHLEFVDSGTGMKEEVRERVFEPFYTTKGVHGTGLGLAVSYGIIERHEGMISVESKMGQGTTFHIELPVATREDCAPDETHLTVSAEPLSILVIDDEEFVRETLAEMLADLDHSVVTVDGGAAALKKVASENFDVVFTDLAMPEMDGWETARAIRDERPGLPIVLVTGYGATVQPPSGESDLVTGIIGKPFDFDQVTATLSRVCVKDRASLVVEPSPQVELVNQ